MARFQSVSVAAFFALAPLDALAQTGGQTGVDGRIALFTTILIGAPLISAFLARLFLSNPVWAGLFGASGALALPLIANIFLPASDFSILSLVLSVLAGGALGASFASGALKSGGARGGVFISYRRNDTSSEAGRLYDHLVEKLGERRVFKDVDSIPPGVDFAEHITQYIQSGAKVLVLIGPDWMRGENAERLNDPEDFVRQEIELARKAGAKVIPVLVSGATMPSKAELPDSLSPLTRINAMRLRPDPDFRRDAQTVISAVRR